MARRTAKGLAVLVASIIMVSIQLAFDANKELDLGQNIGYYRELS